MTGPRATITLSRTSPDDVGVREIYVSIDGRRVAVLRPGETVTEQVPPGHHRIRAHNTLFWRTIDCELRPGDEARFLGVNRAGRGTFSILALLGAGPLYLQFDRVDVAR